jgi:hypothetical protein
MTSTTSSTSEAPSTIRVRDSAKVIEFQGRLVGEISTETPREPRWLEIQLFKVDDGRYVVHLIGRSVVYHGHMSSCNRGIPRRVLDIPSDAEPCRDCRPVRYDLNDLLSEEAEALVDMESDRHTAYVCADGEEVLNRLRVPNRRHPEELGVLSAPAQRLINLVAPLDDGIASVVTTVERL